jgi:ribosomal protein L9
MSQVVTDTDEIQGKNLKTIVPGIDRAFLVEEFNKILVTKCKLADFTPGIRVFIEKEDLLERMTNSYLDDTIERAARDPQRKLGENDRIFGTIKLAREYGIEPVNIAKAATAGMAYLAEH